MAAPAADPQRPVRIPNAKLLASAAGGRTLQVLCGKEAVLRINKHGTAPWSNVIVEIQTPKARSKQQDSASSAAAAARSNNQPPTFLPAKLLSSVAFTVEHSIMKVSKVLSSSEQPQLEQTGHLLKVYYTVGMGDAARTHIKLAAIPDGCTPTGRNQVQHLLQKQLGGPGGITHVVYELDALDFHNVLLRGQQEGHVVDACYIVQWVGQLDLPESDRRIPDKCRRLYVNSVHEVYDMTGNIVASHIRNLLYLPHPALLDSFGCINTNVAWGTATQPVHLVIARARLRDMLQSVIDTYGKNWSAAVLALLSPPLIAAGKWQLDCGDTGNHITVLHSDRPSTGKTTLLAAQAHIMGRPKSSIVSDSATIALQELSFRSVHNNLVQIDDQRTANQKKQALVHRIHGRPIGEGKTNGQFNSTGVVVITSNAPNAFLSEGATCTRILNIRIEPKPAPSAAAWIAIHQKVEDIKEGCLPAVLDLANNPPVFRLDRGHIPLLEFLADRMGARGFQEALNIAVAGHATVEAVRRVLDDAHAEELLHYIKTDMVEHTLATQSSGSAVLDAVHNSLMLGCTTKASQQGQKCVLYACGARLLIGKVRAGMHSELLLCVDWLAFSGIMTAAAPDAVVPARDQVVPMPSCLRVTKSSRCRRACA